MSKLGTAGTQPAQAMFLGVGQTGTTAATHAEFPNAVGPSTTLLRITVTADTWVRIGPPGTQAKGDGTDAYFGVGTEVVACNPGDIVSYQWVSAAGQINIVEGGMG